MPETLTFQQGAAIGIAYLTAWRALVQAGRGRPGETVLIHGATGGVGLAALQIARNQGMRVFATGGSEAGRALLKDQGATLVFDHQTSDYGTQILEATRNKGVDLILEMLANVNLGTDLTLLGRFGRVVIVGSRGPVEINPRDLMMRDAEIRGIVGPNMLPEDRASALAGLQAGFTNRTLVPIVGAEFPLEAAAQAHERIISDTHTGKIVLACSPPPSSESF